MAKVYYCHMSIPYTHLFANLKQVAGLQQQTFNSKSRDRGTLCYKSQVHYSASANVHNSYMKIKTSTVYIKLSVFNIINK